MAHCNGEARYHVINRFWTTTELYDTEEYDIYEILDTRTIFVK